MKMCIVLILFVFCNMDANAQMTNAIGGVADWIEFSPAFHEDNTEEPKKRNSCLIQLNRHS